MNYNIELLKTQMAACRVCEAHLELGPRPIFQIDESAKILIIGQAPGIKVHQSGVPWDDVSGTRLRDWLGVTSDQFYRSGKIGILPMGLCFPGTGPKGDLPPRPECAPLWHPPVLETLTNVELTIYIGAYSFTRYLSSEFESMTEAIQYYEKLLPARIAMPHPSPRNRFWIQKNPWFEVDVLPKLRGRVSEMLN